MILLSILIPSTYDRSVMTEELEEHLSKQCGDMVDWEIYEMGHGFTFHTSTYKEVEIFIYYDHGVITTGEKRNFLYHNAKGKYSVSVDSDDWVPDYYVCELLEAAKSEADCFAINGVMITDNVKTETWSISKDHPYKTVTGNMGKHYLRYPNHICPIKSEICKQFKFPDTTFGEDYDWATQIHNSGLIKTEYTIHKPLYEYRYNSQK